MTTPCTHVAPHSAKVKQTKKWFALQTRPRVPFEDTLCYVNNSDMHRCVMGGAEAIFL